MKTRNRSTKLLATALAAVVLTAIFAVWGARPAEAIIIINNKTGLFGIAPGQKVRVSVLNAARARGGIMPRARVFDLAGNMIAEFEGRALPVGEGLFFDFDAGPNDPNQGQRMQVRVEVSLEAVPPPDQGRSPRLKPDEAILTAEVFDNATGRTVFSPPFVLTAFNPQPEPPISEQ